MVLQLKLSFESESRTVLQNELQELQVETPTPNFYILKRHICKRKSQPIRIYADIQWRKLMGNISNKEFTKWVNAIKDWSESRKYDSARSRTQFETRTLPLPQRAEIKRKTEFTKSRNILRNIRDFE